jgi:tetratricopeptide (TPR) repeat protein
LNNLGNVYEDLGDTHKAKEVLERALLINEHHYGSKHPQVAMTLSSLADAEASLNNFSSCLAHSKRCLDIFMTHFGADHSYTKYVKALYERCLSKTSEGETSTRVVEKPVNPIQQTTSKRNKNKKSEYGLC